MSLSLNVIFPGTLISNKCILEEGGGAITNIERIRHTLKI